MAEGPALALTSLAFQTLGDRDRKPLESEASEHGLVPLGRALAELTDDPAVPRLVKLDQLVRLAVRRPDFFRDLDGLPDALEPFLQSLAPPEDDGGGTRDEVARVVLGSLQEISGISTMQAAWDGFVENAGDTLALTAAEDQKPQCNDGGQVQTRSPSGTTITARMILVTFKTAIPVNQLLDYVNPTVWPTCSIYFTAMHPIPPSMAMVTHPDYNAWLAGYEEHCRAIPPSELVTPLLFRGRQARDLSYLRTTYELIQETKDIVFDSGYIDVTDLGGGAPASQRTSVEAAKVIAFKQPFLQRWTSVACDTFWMELAINMALGCQTQPGAPVTEEEQ